MAKAKFDVIIEAVRYHPDGWISWVRGYERRGPTFSDLILIQREELIQRLKAGEKIVYGQRLPYLASTFAVTGQIQLHSHNNAEMIATENAPVVGHDNLTGVPIL